MHTELIALMAIPLLLVLRIILLLPVRQPSDARSTAGKKRRADERCSLGVFLGSGGHTAEMCTLLSSTDFARYSPRTYTYCPGDEHSLRLVRELERSKAGGGSSEASYSFLPLPRARKVKQPFLSTVFTSIGTLLVAIASLFVLPLLRNPLRPGFEVLLVNGPGTCVLVVAVCWIRRVLGLPYTRIIYVESFARVTSLSLSAKLLRPFVDTFVVQWPQVANGGSEHASVEGKSWPDDGTAEVTPLRQKGRTGWRDWLRGRTVYKGWLV